MADGTIYAAARDVTCDVVAEDEARRRTQDQMARVQAALAVRRQAEVAGGADIHLRRDKPNS